ncbi:hypothetical protein ACFFKU_07020 [Kineococcus gynurae]|uniref:Uncharacterized protein n=1 Tax=Kineococcus gynurae TaxID=452979 RepID=A0ABV5LWW8_9ACTN
MTAPDPTPTAAQPVRDMLSEHIPLSLIMDLAAPDGPHSAELLASEGLPTEEWWVAR